MRCRSIGRSAVSIVRGSPSIGRCRPSATATIRLATQAAHGLSCVLPAMTPEQPERPILLSDQPTMELIVRAKTGDGDAIEALLQRCLPALKRWVHGRLPPAARGTLETDDIVQSVIMQWLRRLPHFEPTQVGATMAYLRRSALNRIRDEVRRITRQPPASELIDDVAAE